MCGRFAVTALQQEVVDAFDVVDSESDILTVSRPDVRPTQNIAVIRTTHQRRQLCKMRWGFLPDWYDRPDSGPLIINARSETIAQKPAFAKACRQRRCLIPANGFYEWQVLGRRGKRVHWIAPKGEALFGFAGIWQRWGDYDTCAIVTCAASPELNSIHHRLPVVVQPEHYDLWLGEAGHGAARLMTAAPKGFWCVEPDRAPPDSVERLL